MIDQEAAFSWRAAGEVLAFSILATPRIRSSVQKCTDGQANLGLNQRHYRVWNILAISPARSSAGLFDSTDGPGQRETKTGAADNG